MKDLTNNELMQISGGLTADSTQAPKTIEFENPGLSQRQWTQLAGMAVSAIITHTMPNGPQKSITNIAGFAAVSWACNVAFALM